MGGCELNARDYFESIRSEVIDVERACEMLERMRSREDAEAQRYDASRGSCCVEPPDLIARRIDFERRLAFRIEESRKSVDEALEILYGRDGRGGLAKAKGAIYADAICMRYCQAEPWREIAETMRCSTAWAHRLCDVGFEEIDVT